MMAPKQNTDIPAAPPKPSPQSPAPSERKLNNMRNFLVLITSEGEVITRSVFGENNDLYKNVATIALKQNSQTGEFISDSIRWRFMMRNHSDGSRTIALADITAERAIITRLIISFTICSLLLLFIVFFISMN